MTRAIVIVALIGLLIGSGVRSTIHDFLGNDRKAEENGCAAVIALVALVVVLLVWPT